MSFERTIRLHFWLRMQKSLVKSDQTLISKLAIVTCHLNGFFEDNAIERSWDPDPSSDTSQMCYFICEMISPEMYKMYKMKKGGPLILFYIFDTSLRKETDRLCIFCDTVYTVIHRYIWWKVNILYELVKCFDRQCIHMKCQMGKWTVMNKRDWAGVISIVNTWYTWTSKLS